MKRIYGCDVWDGVCNVFNRAVGKPLGQRLDEGLDKLFDYLHEGEGKAHMNRVGKVMRATGITTVWNVLSGNNLLKKHDVAKMDEDSVFVVRLLGTTLAVLSTPTVMATMGVTKGSSSAAALVFGMVYLGFATASLPRNAYVACKAQKQADMEHETNGYRPQPPQAW